MNPGNELHMNTVVKIAFWKKNNALACHLVISITNDLYHCNTGSSCIYVHEQKT